MNAIDKKKSGNNYREEKDRVGQRAPGLYRAVYIIEPQNIAGISFRSFREGYESGDLTTHLPFS